MDFGGALLGFTSWRGVFIALALYGLILLPIAARLLPETLPSSRRRTARPGAIVRTYGGLLTDRVSVGLVLTAGLVMSAVFAYVAGSSFVFQEQFGVDGAVVSPLVGVLGNDATAMGAVVAAAIALALAVLVVVVRPWQLTGPDVPSAALAH